MNLIQNRNEVTAFAPATSANVAVGFDILGFSFSPVGDEVTLTLREDKKIVIESIQTVFSDETLPFEAEQNTASVVLQKACHDLKLDSGFSITIKKGIPMSSGMGGSAASAVAALTAFNAFLTSPLSLEKLAEYALVGEQTASGDAHPDNIVPCLFGGLTLIQNMHPMNVILLPIPKLYCVLLHPHLQLSTKTARAALKSDLPLKQYVQQSAHLAVFISALYENNINRIKEVLSDVLIEPYRAKLLPHFYDLKKSALENGAIGASFSGSGPALFAFSESEQNAKTIAHAMQTECTRYGMASDVWIAPLSSARAHVTHINGART